MNNRYPYLLNREQASEYLGIDPQTFDKYIRSNEALSRFMVGARERYTLEALETFIKKHSI